MTSALDSASADPSRLYGIDLTPPAVELAQFTRLNALHSQCNWPTTPAFSQDYVTSGNRYLPFAVLEELCSAKGQYDDSVSSRLNMTSSSSWGPFDAGHKGFQNTSHNMSEMTILPTLADPDAQVLNTTYPSYPCIGRILTPQSDMPLSPDIDLRSPPALTRHLPEEGKGLCSAFLFVDNSDKETAARLRNVLTNRKRRKQKMSRVAELEEKLLVMENEKNTWKRKAEYWRKALADNQNRT